MVLSNSSNDNLNHDLKLIQRFSIFTIIFKVIFLIMTFLNFRVRSIDRRLIT